MADRYLVNMFAYSISAGLFLQPLPKGCSIPLWQESTLYVITIIKLIIIIIIEIFLQCSEYPQHFATVLYPPHLHEWGLYWSASIYLTTFIYCSLYFSFLLSSTIRSSIIFGILSRPIPFKWPNYLNCLSYITSIMLWCTFIISLLLSFFIFFFLDSLEALRQKSIPVANNLFTWYIPNSQVSAQYNLKFSTNDIKRKVSIVFTLFLSHIIEFNKTFNFLRLSSFLNFTINFPVWF